MIFLSLLPLLWANPQEGTLWDYIDSLPHSNEAPTAPIEVQDNAEIDPEMLEQIGWKGLGRRWDYRC